MFNGTNLPVGRFTSKRFQTGDTGTDTLRSSFQGVSITNTTAAKSRILDVDVAQEPANSTRLSTLAVVCAGGVGGTTRLADFLSSQHPLVPVHPRC